MTHCQWLGSLSISDLEQWKGEETLGLRIHEIRYYYIIIIIIIIDVWTGLGRIFVGDPGTRKEAIVAQGFWIPSDRCCEASGRLLNLSDSLS